MSGMLILGTDVFSKGGIQRYTRYQFAALQATQSARVDLFSLYPPKRGNQFEERIDVAYVANGLSAMSKLRYAWNVLQFVRKHRVSLIISTHLQLSIIAYVAKLLFSTRYATNIYGIEVWGDLKFRDRLGLLKSDHLIGDCRFVLNYIQKNFELRGDTLLLYDPVDMDRFKPVPASEEVARRYGIPRDAMIVMTVGRLERNKGHRVMIETLARLPDNVVYVAVGGGFMDEELREWARAKGVADRVIFTGRIPEDDLVSVYNLADVVLLLSNFGRGEGEGLPLGLIEGSACAKPIICGNEDGSAEAYDAETPNGYLVSPTDVAAVARALTDYLHSPELRKQHGEAGRRYVERNFNFLGFRSKLGEMAAKYLR
jgi:glycosyltransferase involved in cell wall biosynthesis